MRQKWGQNFLVDDRICRGIVDALGAGADDAVLEIGPGKGALTKHLAGKVRALTLVELDRALAERLRARWGDVPGLSVVNEDFLKWPLPEPGAPVKVAANLPYSAAAAILRRLLEWPGWSEAVVMVQKEVARRMAAGPGSREYGILSLAVQNRATVKALFDVGPGAFKPAPKVVSTVLRLTRLPAPRAPREEAFFRAVHAAFGQRRKTLLNSLAHGLDMEKGKVETALKACGLDPGVRAETVGLEAFEKLSRVLEG
jgi:16S rRNA (adenine1518-N6/adenine1519-N6)-dimethyltransferase